jgi:hypothetical protein
MGWKGLQEKNALAFYEKGSFTAVKSFITLATGCNFWVFGTKRERNLRLQVTIWTVQAFSRIGLGS